MDHGAVRVEVRRELCAHAGDGGVGGCDQQPSASVQLRRLPAADEQSPWEAGCHGPAHSAGSDHGGVPMHFPELRTSAVQRCRSDLSQTFDMLSRMPIYEYLCADCSTEFEGSCR